MFSLHPSYYHNEPVLLPHLFTTNIWRPARPCTALHGCRLEKTKHYRIASCNLQSPALYQCQTSTLDSKPGVLLPRFFCPSEQLISRLLFEEALHHVTLVLLETPFTP